MNFKFLNSPSSSFGACIILLFYACITVAVVVQANLRQGLLVALVLFPFSTIAAYSSFVMGLDLTVDDVGISRIFMGKKLQSLTWTNIKILKDFTMATPGRARRYFQALPVKSTKIVFPFGSKMTISSRMYNFEKFVKVMNVYLKSNNIKIERMSDGECISCNEITSN